MKMKKQKKKTKLTKEDIAWLKLGLKLTPYERLLVADKLREAYFQGFRNEPI